MGAKLPSYRENKESALVDSFISICEDCINRLKPCMKYYNDLYDHYNMSGEAIIGMSKLLNILHFRNEERLSNHPLYPMEDLNSKETYTCYLADNRKVFNETEHDISLEDVSDSYFREYEGAEMGCGYTGVRLHKIPLFEHEMVLVIGDSGSMETEYLNMSPENFLKETFSGLLSVDMELYPHMDFLVSLVDDTWLCETETDIEVYYSTLVADFLNFGPERINDEYVWKAQDIINRMGEYSVLSDHFFTTKHAAYWFVINGCDERGEMFGDEQLYPTFYYMALELDVLLRYIDSIYHFSREGGQADGYTKAA